MPFTGNINANAICDLGYISSYIERVFYLPKMFRSTFKHYGFTLQEMINTVIKPIMHVIGDPNPMGPGKDGLNGCVLTSTVPAVPWSSRTFNSMPKLAVKVLHLPAEILEGL